VSLYDNDNREVRLPGYRVDALTDAAIRYVDQHQQDPFFLFLSFIEPHFQNSRDDYPAPTGYAERFTGRWMPADLAALGGTAHQHLGGYYGMVKRLDEALGRLLDALQSLDLLNDTIVVFTSDHGNHFKTRNGEYKRSCHESSIRIPMAIQGPGFDAGGRIQKLVSLLDLPPTLLDACRIPVPEALQGRSILPLLRKEPVSWPEEIYIQISESEVGRAIRTGRWKYSVTAPGLDGGRFVASNVYRDDCLYDLYADPYELNNRIDHEAYQDVKQILHERLMKRLIAAGEEAPRFDELPVKEPRGQRKLNEGAGYQ
jgi:arylsulfatase A-like enzyme